MLEYFLKKSVVTICLNLVILMLGVFSFPKIAREFIPAIDIPAVAVVYPTTVHSLETVRNELLDPVEDLLLKTGVIDRIESFYENGNAVLLLFFTWNLKPEECIQRARQALISFKAIDGIANPLFILHRPTMAPIYRVAFDGDSVTQLTNQLQTLSQKLERLPGVAQIRTIGGAQENTVISYQVEDLAKHKVLQKTFLEQIATKWGFRRLLFDSSGAHNLSVNLSNSDQLLNLEIPNTKNQLIPVKFFAKKYRDEPEPQVLNKQGNATLILEVIKAPGSDAVALTETVQNEISSFLSENKKIQQTIIYNEAEKIVDSQAGVFSNFLSGIFLNSLVLMIFLGSFTGVVVASSIFPTTILGTLFILKQTGISLNIFSLNGFSLAAGMITDASTVVLESIMRRVQNGEEVESASLKGAKDILIGVITGTLSSAAVMLPICLQSGVSSKLFSDLGYTLILTQVLSLVTVFTFVPWLCYKMLKKDAKQNRAIEVLYQGSSVLVNSFIQLSSKTLKLCSENLTIRWVLPGTIAFLCIGSLFFLPSSELLPVVKANTYSLSIPFSRDELKLNSQKFIQKMTTILKDQKEIEWAITNVDSDSLLLTFKATKEFQQDSFVSLLASNYQTTQAHILIFPLGPTPPTEPMNYHGYFYLNKNIPRELRENLTLQFCKTPGIADCETYKHYQADQMSLINNTLSMTRQNTNPIEVALSAAIEINTVQMNSVAGLTMNEQVTLKAIGDQSLLQSAFYSLGKSDGSLMSLDHLYLKNLSKVSLTQFRVNSSEFDPLYFKLEGITLGTAIEKMEQLKRSLGIDQPKVKGMGAILNMEETFGKMIFALGISLALTVIILMIQFKSAVQTAIIMFSIPLAIGGAVMGLLLLKETVNISVMVGFILLGGIIVNNGILLMEALNQRLEQTSDLLEAILDAVKTRTRPIIMTSVSAIAGMMPTLLFESEGQELYRGMAIVNIFGMGFGTILTLIITPVFCWIFLRRKYDK